MRMSAALAVLVLLGTAAPPPRDCARDPGNMLGNANCGFNKDVQRWTAAPGATVAFAADDSDGGLLQAVSDAQGSLTITGPCVKAQPVGEYKFSARLRKTSGEAYFCSVNAWQFSDESCTAGQEPLASAGVPPSAEWQAVDGSAVMARGAKSIQLRPVCSGQAGFVVQFDDFVLAQH